MYEGSFSAGSVTEEDLGPLTGEHIKAAMRELDMAGKRIPKKKKPRGDSRRAKYSARQFGNILLSMTKDIESNTTLSDAIGGELAMSLYKLIEPIFEEFFL